MSRCRALVRDCPWASRFAPARSIAAFACTSSEVNSSSTASRSARKPTTAINSPPTSTAAYLRAMPGRRTARTREPLVAQLAAEVVGLRQPSSRHPGLDRFFQEATWLWAAIFAASTASLAVAMAIASAEVVELLTTAVTIGGVVAGAFLSALWFVRVLRRLGLHVRFTQA